MNETTVSTINLQQKASNPNSSCWVNASAGSGKTKVLIDRIIRLLLHCANPDRILCLTFSRAAASEMQQRLLQKIKLFAELPDLALTDELLSLGEQPTSANVTKAKNLYSIIKSQPVSIQTVHSFCQSLLQRQMGQNILNSTPRVMENFEERTYLTQAFEKLIEDEDATHYLEEFFIFHGETVLFEYLSSTTRTIHSLNFDDAQKRLFELFDISGAPQFPLPPLEIQGYLKGLLNVTIPNDAVSKEHNFAQCFLTQKGTVRAKILPASIQKQYPDAEPIFKIYAEELAHYFSKKIRFDQVQKSLHFWQLQQIFQKHYKHLKETHNLWDFHDLIEKTLQTLKLDDFDQILLDLNYRIDHLLVDEAQDTSVDQWHVIEHLVQGLFDHHSTARSVFVVGDEKQSIYSFQGADIRMYQDMQKHISILCQPWENVALSTSFRSAKDILNVVDRVFEQNPKGLGKNVSKHIAYQEFRGCIEILPFIELKIPKIDPWPIFETYSDAHEPEQYLAEQVLNHIEQSIANGLFLASENRHATYDDFMILMRKRGRQMQEITSACQDRDIPYSAFDPKNLMECLVVRDLLSAVEFMLMPLNDLNLAALLKTPWMQQQGKIDENDLFNLCHSRKGSLWDEVQTHYQPHTKKLNQLLQSSPSSAYNYFQSAYDAMNVECELLNSFMDDVFKRFNLLKLSIRELVEHLHKYPPVFTQTNHQKGIKLSTVHGAKGLESPVVIILDHGDEVSMKQDTLLYDPVAQFWFLKPPTAADTILTAALKEHHQQALEFEHNRLFYVALTRAKEHLILAGLPHEQSPNSWYWRVSEAVKENVIAPI